MPARRKFSLTLPTEVLDRLHEVAREHSRTKLRAVSLASLVIDAVVAAYFTDPQPKEANVADAAV